MKNQPLHIQYGLYTSIVLIILSVLSYLQVINISVNVSIILTFIIIAIGIALCTMQFAKQNYTGKDIFFNGIKIAAFITIVQLLFGIVVLIIYPKIKNDQVAIFKNEIQKNITSELKHTKDSVLKLNTASATKFFIQDSTTKMNSIIEDVKTYNSHFNTSFIGLNLMKLMLMGLIGSLISAILFRKKSN